MFSILNRRKQTGALLRDIRKAIGVKAGDVAAAIGYTPGGIANIEADRRGADEDVVARYLQYLAERVTTMQRRNLLMTAAALPSAAVLPTAGTFAGLVAGAVASLAPADRDGWEERLADRFAGYLVDVGRCADGVAADVAALDAQGSPVALASVTARVAALQAQAGPAADAAQWWDVAAVAADQSGELPVRVWTAGRGALDLAYDLPTVPQALALADKAISLADGHVSAGLVHALFARAHIAAAIGSGEAVPLLHEAIDAADLLDEADASPSAMGSGIARWQTWLGGAHLAAKLGEATLFASMREAFEDDAPTERGRFGAHMLMYEALLLAGLGEGETAARVVEDALRPIPVSNRSASLLAMRDEVVATA